MPIEKLNWEDRFLNQFEYLIKPIKVTPYYGEDLEKAKILQEAYSNIGEDIKSFIKNLILEREKELYAKMEDMKKIEIPDFDDPINKDNETYNYAVENCQSLLDIDEK